MPSEKVLQDKQEFVAKLAEKLDGSVAGVVVNYQGITVADDTALRKKLREAGVDYAVVKNTMLRRAAEKVGLNGLDSVLEGATALAVSPTDHVAAAKILCEYAEKSKKSSFESRRASSRGRPLTRKRSRNWLRCLPRRSSSPGPRWPERPDQRLCYRAHACEPAGAGRKSALNAMPAEKQSA